MTNHRADSAEVYRVIQLLSEERRLQDAGREDDLVELPVVIGVYRRWCHIPFGLIDWLADLIRLSMRLKLRRPNVVAEKIVAADPD